MDSVIKATHSDKQASWIVLFVVCLYCDYLCLLGLWGLFLFCVLPPCLPVGFRPGFCPGFRPGFRVLCQGFCVGALYWAPCVCVLAPASCLQSALRHSLASRLPPPLHGPPPAALLRHPPSTCHLHTQQAICVAFVQGFVGIGFFQGFVGMAVLPPPPPPLTL